MVTPYIVFNGNCKEDTYALGVKSRDKSGGRYLDGMKQKEGSSGRSHSRMACTYQRGEQP